MHMDWLISANSRIYDYASSFAHHGSIDWRQGNVKYSLGDIVYIYCTTPIQRIRYKCQITELNKNSDQIRDDQAYWLKSEEYYKSLNSRFFRLDLLEEIDSEKLSLPLLLQHGLNAAPQSPTRLSEELRNYITSIFRTADNDFFPDIRDTEYEIFEGIKKQVLVNKFERSSIARAKCIEKHGYCCKVCGFNFEELYGDLGKDFIHVHHLVPIHTIGKSYKIDYANDLIPVCPNCHAMLHRKLDDRYYSVSDLQELIQSKSKPSDKNS